MKVRFEDYLDAIIHEWLKTLTAFAYTLVPIFFILDYFTMPKELIPKFGLYRLASTIIVLVQYFIIRHTKPSKRSFYHGYLVSINVGGIIALMTVDLGGFNSAYYAGLNLVIIGVNLLLPWKSIHTAINSFIIVAMYILLNVIWGAPFDPMILTNNLFFMCSTAIMAVSINYVRHKLVKQEFFLRQELQEARDSLWSEMELAKRIQTALLPNKQQFKGYDIAATMIPAQEVGGDYYDVIETPSKSKWIAMGDVSGHGVDSGLIMMMAQTSIQSVITRTPDASPSMVLSSVNDVIRENILRLGSDHYMTIVVMHLNETGVTTAGKHQDLLVYRASLNTTEVIPTRGTWLGIADDISDYLTDTSIDLKKGDVVLLFTDGITEAMDKEGEMFGQSRLENTLSQHANLPAEKIVDKIIEEVRAYQAEQADDMTLVIVKKLA